MTGLIIGRFPTQPRRIRAGLLALFAALALAPLSARAHFFWLLAEREDEAPVVRGFLSETPTPDLPEFLKHIRQAKVSVGGGSLAWAVDDNTYRVALPESTPPVIDGSCDLGVMTRGEATFRLLYTARAQFAPAKPDAAEEAESLRLRLEAAPGGGPAVVRLTLRGKPVAGALVKAFPEAGDVVELKSDDRGIVPAEGVAEGRTALLAKWIEEASGEVDGKPYKEIRYYTTLTVAPEATKEAGVDTSSPSSPFALLPEAVNSFGGAVAGDWLYVYSGHTGETHKYHRGTTTPHFRRLNLKDRTTWEELPPGPALQGVTLMAHGGKLYRIGGMSAHNAQGEANDLRSVADFARFDPDAKTWTDLPPLPAPRSTHDAVVVGDKIYVVGGWSMMGGDSSGAEFCEDALVYDLAKPDARWEPIPEPPFRRRALAVAENGGKLYVLGGLTEESSIAKSVDVFDIASGTWSSGPELPGGKLVGFAPSAFGVEGRLYVSGHDGLVHRLNAKGDGWEVAGKLVVPRLTHRLLPGINGDLLAVGGTFANVPSRVVESVPLEGSAEPGPRILTWSTPSTTLARQGQAVALIRSKLVAVGGNRTTKPHAFAAENLVAEAESFALGRMEASSIDALPEVRQSAVLAAPAARNAPAYLVGGIGPDGDVSRTLGDVFQLDLASGRWSKHPTATIPDDRGMFGMASYRSALWIFGGSVWDPRKGPGQRAMTMDVLRWDLGRDGASFEPTGQKLPRARRSFAGAVLGSKYYLVGGLGEDLKLVEPVDVFDFEDGTWGTIPAPRPRLFADLVTLDGKLYLAGGFVRPAQGHPEPARTIESYDPAKGTWTTLLEESPIPARNARLLAAGGRLLLFAPGSEPGDPARFALIAP
jgi:N-acetylneuraminic acid mutarotase